MADLPDMTGLAENPRRGYVAYADDLCAWSMGDSADTVKRDLAMIADRVSRYTAANYLSLSAEKTQILWSGLPQGIEGPKIDIDGMSVTPSPFIELLGVRFDKNLTPAPFLNSQLRAAMPILAMVRRLACYLPPAPLAQVAAAFLVGKIAYAAAATHAPRLTQDDPLKPATNKLQICLNNAARIILGATRANKLQIRTLLVKTGLPSLNHLVVRGIAVECWRAMNMDTPLGAVISGGHRAARPTRMTTANKLPPPFKFPKESMAWHAVKLWNEHEDLRNATSLCSAKRVAGKIAATCPL